MKRTSILWLALLPALCAEEPPPRLFEWERGIALQQQGREDLTMYLWFYEWNMFEARSPGQHTPGTFEMKRVVGPGGADAVIEGPGIRLSMRAVKDGAELALEITNQTTHDWPAIAGIIPCWNPGRVAGSEPTKPIPLNPNFADRAHDRTYFLAAGGLALLDSRAIHFNHALRPRVDPVSPQGQFVFSYKWPTSNIDARAGILIRESSDRTWVTGIGWEDYLSVQGHNPWSCMHASIRVGPLKPGESKKIRGRLYLFPGNRDHCLDRFERRSPESF